MRIALAQIDTTVGAIEENAAKVRKFTERAKEEGAELVVFPEQTLPGYPARDRLELPEVIRRNAEVLAELATPAPWNRGVAIVVGFAEPHDGPGAGLYNAAAFIVDGTRVATARKTLLPTYDVFDEGRYFDPSPAVTVVQFRGMRLGLSICEDIWNDKRFWSRRRYPVDPIEQLAAAGAELILNVSASPFAQGKPRLRDQMLGAAARNSGLPVVYVNQAGGNDALVFDGFSSVYGRDGQVIYRAPGFAESLTVMDTAAAATPVPEHAPDLAQVMDALVLGVRDYATKTGFSRAVIGLSGGVDSALVAVIAARALGGSNVTTLAMPSRFTAAMSNDDAAQLARNLGTAHHVVPIERIVADYERELAPLFTGKPRDVTEENLQARTRGGLLMAYSNKFNALLLTTGNKSELSVGYCTLYGDMCGGLAVIGDLLKTTVYAVCRHINASAEVIPERILTRAPSAELREGQKDQDSLPPYDQLDRVLEAYVVDRRPRQELIAQGFDAALVNRVVAMVMRAEYKRRQSAPVLRVSPKAFGEGWRFPIAQRWR
jgi:NAD+ synthase (glutamine-hydrolysing)